MKRLTLTIWVTILLSLNGCGGIKGLMTYGLDPSLKNIKEVRALPMVNSIGFEWKKIEDYHIRGINVYRTLASQGEQRFKLVGTIGNRYATHFVDTHVKPNTSYIYLFKTFSMGRESKEGVVLHVKTQPPFEGVSFVKAYKVAPGVVKLLWKPHPNERINTYIIQRSVNGGAWKYLSQAEGRLMVEYIDTFVRYGNSYQYRIIAKSYDGVQAKPSHPTRISL
jgi:fibronectin type 3 domain-containing protein